MRKPLLAVVLALTLVPAAALAQASVGLRLGYGVPMGKAYEQSGLGTINQSGLAKGQVPVQLDASWRFSQALHAGVYLGYGFAQTGSKLKELCATPGSSCDSPSTLRYGVQASWTFQTNHFVDPWVGLAVGVESASFQVKQFTYGVIPGAPPTLLQADLKGTLRGWQASLEGGVDHKLSATFVAGPYVGLGMGQYTVEHITLAGQGTVAGGGVDSAKSHQWLSFGVRGRFDL